MPDRKGPRRRPSPDKQQQSDLADGSDQTGAVPSVSTASATADTAASKPPRKSAVRCNTLDGKRWLQNSVSIWSDIRKSPAELQLKHPAMFPLQLVTRLLETLLPPGTATVFDPFAGVGSTLLAAQQLGHNSVGFELSAEFAKIARQRFAAQSTGPVPVLFEESSSAATQRLEAGSIDICVTSPPYWNILNQRRTADLKQQRHYGNLPDDLGIIADYREFLAALQRTFAGVFSLLRPGAYAAVVIMDLRKKDQFFPFHSDLAVAMQAVGFVWDDLIVWNRQNEYNNLRPLGYPAVFRVNKVHEFILLMQKPRERKPRERKPRTKRR